MGAQQLVQSLTINSRTQRSRFDKNFFLGSSQTVPKPILLCFQSMQHDKAQNERATIMPVSKIQPQNKIVLLHASGWSEKDFFPKNKSRCNKTKRQNSQAQTETTLFFNKGCFRKTCSTKKTWLNPNKTLWSGKENESKLHLGKGSEEKEKQRRILKDVCFCYADVKRRAEQENHEPGSWCLGFIEKTNQDTQPTRSTKSLKMQIKSGFGGMMTTMPP